MGDCLEVVIQQELGGKILEEMEYIGGVPSVHEVAMKCALGEDPSVNEGRIVEKKKKTKEMDFTAVHFFDSFFSDKNNEEKVARIKVISPDNFAILAFNGTRKMEEITRNRDYNNIFEKYIGVFLGDELGSSLRDYVLFLYSLGVDEVHYFKGDTKNVGALLKYILKSLDISYMGPDYHWEKDEDGRTIVGFQDESGHVLYWDEAEMPVDFRTDLLLRAVNEFDKIFNEASNMPEGEDVYRYFYENPLPSNDFKILKFTGEQDDEFKNL